MSPPPAPAAPSVASVNPDRPLDHAVDADVDVNPVRLPAWWRFVEDGLVLNLATLLMLASMACMFYEATNRTVLGESNWWAEELVRFLVVWSILLSFGLSARHGHFIRMELVADALPRSGRTALAWLNAVVGLVFCVVLTVAGVREVAHLAASGMLTDSNLDLPLWIVRLALPIGGALYALYFVGALVALATARPLGRTDAAPSV